MPVGRADRSAFGEARRGRLSFMSDDRLGTWGCLGEGDLWADRLRRQARIAPARPDAGEYDLRIGVKSSLPDAHPVVGGVIRGISLRGLEVLTEPADPLDGARRQIVIGSPSVALKDPALPEWGIERLIALDDGGDRDGVRRVLARYVKQPDAALAPLIRLRRERLVPLLRAMLPPSTWQKRFFEAWFPVAMSDPADPQCTAAFTEDLKEIVTGDDPEMAAVLELQRGNAWVRAGRRDAARLDYTNAITHAVEPTTRASARVELAGVEVAENHPDAAMVLLESALAESPTPILLADAIVVRGDLRPLHALPAWESRVERARRLSE